MRDDGVARRPLDRGQAAEQLRAGAGAGGHRHVFQPAHRADVALRRLDRDRIGDAGLRVQPVGRRGLRAAGQAWSAWRSPRPFR